jgi:hypothetical protein
MELVHISAFSDDFDKDFYRFWFANQQSELVPKDICKFLEAQKTGKDFGEGIDSRWFELPLEVARELEGLKFYGGDLDFSAAR